MSMHLRSLRLVLPLLTAFAACEGKLQPSDECVLSAHGVTPSSTACYRVPSSVYLGVLWPGDDGTFRIPVIEEACQLFGAKERLIPLRAPGGSAWSEAKTHSWQFPETVRPGEEVTIVNSRGGSIRLRLPAADYPFLIDVLRNDSGGELLTFANPTAGECTSRGFFGFVAFDGAQ